MGPLAGVKVVEVGGLGPGPFAGMLLADLGAEVVVAHRQGQAPGGFGPLDRGKRFVGVDLKDPDGLEVLLRLADGADVLVEPFRPGVAARLGFGPEVACARNPGLVYVHLTGYGQDGPLASAAGHDIDYLAVSGTLDPLGRAGGPPTPPINVLGDFAGGGAFAVIGVLAALHERASSGRGQVIDAAMVDGAAVLLAPFFTGRIGGGWGPRGTNMLDGAAPFYDSYRCADDAWLAIGALEPQFYVALLRGLGLDDEDPADQHDQSRWPALRERIATVVATRTRDEWVEAFADLDACVAPVLTPAEAAAHPHAVARAAFRTDAGGTPEPAPAPRFSRTPAEVGSPTPGPAAALAAFGIPTDEAAALVDAGTVT